MNVNHPSHLCRCCLTVTRGSWRWLQVSVTLCSACRGRQRVWESWGVNCRKTTTTTTTEVQWCTLIPRRLGCLVWTPHTMCLSPSSAIGPRDCSDVMASGVSQDGVYSVFPIHDPNGFMVYCDMTTDGGGWTVRKHANTPRRLGPALRQPPYKLNKR